MSNKKNDTRKPLSQEFETFPVVVLVGRTNVGKSTLFNTILEQKKAVTSRVPGTTRDVNYGLCQWRGVPFLLVDTGGYVAPEHARSKNASDVDAKIADHARRMIRAADVVLFLTDQREGFNPDDRRYVRDVRKFTHAPVVLAVNKADQKTVAENMEWSEWSALGLGAPQYVSAISGRGTGDMLDMLIPLFPEKKIKHLTAQNDPEIRVAIVGRTNVGKSSILNRLIGEERVIVSPQPHTTREPQDTLIVADGLTLRVIDTVGMRKKSRVISRIDREGLTRSIAAIERADVVILVLESTVTPSKQESRLVSIAKEHGAALIIVVNKWDLVAEKTTKTPKAYEDFFRQYFKGALWAPVIFISALTGQRVARIIDMIRYCEENRSRSIVQEELDVFLARTIAHQKPVWQRGKKKPVIHAFRQTASRPPTFALSVNDRQSITFAYLRYLENRFRGVYDFIGTPIRIHTEVRDKKSRV